LESFVTSPKINTVDNKVIPTVGYIHVNRFKKCTRWRSAGKNNENKKEIRTKYEVLETKGNLSLVEVELLTGRTHQIRSHFASIGHPLLGDGKYGTNKLNKEKGYKKQCLCSYKLTFDFQSDAGILNYLDGKTFEVDDIWFRDEFLNGTL